MKENILNQILTPGAKERCKFKFYVVCRIRLVKQDKAL